MTKKFAIVLALFLIAVVCSAGCIDPETPVDPVVPADPIVPVDPVTPVEPELPVEEYSVMFMLNYDDAGAYTAETVKAGDTVSRPASPSRSGYTFTGWFTAADGGVAYDFTLAVNSDVMLYAQWKEEKKKSSHSHSYSQIVTDPTCIAEGYTTYTCRCGASYKGDTTTINPDNHDLVLVTNESGEYNDCNRCDYSKVLVDRWDGTVDTTWYNAENPQTEYTLTTAEQFAGLAYLVNDAQSFNPALDNKDTADFGYYSKNEKSATPDVNAAEHSISFEGKTILLAVDLDLCPVSANGDLVTLPGNEQLSMMPVGYSDYTPFKGTFDGQGHTIKNIFQGGWDLYGLDYNNKVKLGLFGCVENATIKNLVVDNIAFNAEMTLGGVAGKVGGTSLFSNITVKNSSIASAGGWWVGGLIGWAYGNLIIEDVTIDETVTVAQNGGHYDTAVGGIIGGCNNVDGESISFKNCNVACKLDVYNDCTANYKTGVYRNCGMVIGGIGEDNEIIENGVKYPDFNAKGLTFENVGVTFDRWADYTYCWSDDLSRDCQRIEPGIGYKGVDVSKITDASVDTSRPFDAIFGAENAGDINNVRKQVNETVMNILGITGINVIDKRVS